MWLSSDKSVKEAHSRHSPMHGRSACVTSEPFCSKLNCREQELLDLIASDPVDPIVLRPFFYSTERSSQLQFGSIFASLRGRSSKLGTSRPDLKAVA